VGKGAASTDYFIILAIVVLIILFAVALMYGVPRLEETRFTQSSNYWQYAAAPFGIIEHNAGPGIFVAVFHNNAKERMAFKKLYLDGNEEALVGGGSLFGTEAKFKAGERSKMVFQTNFACPPGDFYEHTVTVEYEDSYGTPHVETGQIKVFGRCIENPDTGCVECNGRLCCYPAVCANGMCTTCGNSVCNYLDGYPANETCDDCFSDCGCDASCQTCNSGTGRCDTTPDVIGNPCVTSFDCCSGSGLVCYGGRCVGDCVQSGLSCNGNATTCCSFTCEGGNCCQPESYGCNATLPCCIGLFCNSASLHCNTCPTQPGGPCNTTVDCCQEETGWECNSGTHTCEEPACGSYEGAYCDNDSPCCEGLGLTCDEWNRECIGGTPDLSVAVLAPVSWQSGVPISVAVTGTNIGAGRFNRINAVFEIHTSVAGAVQTDTDNALIEPMASNTWNVLSVCNAQGRNDTMYNITGAADDENTTGYTPVVVETTKANNIAIQEIACHCNGFFESCNVDTDCCDRASCYSGVCRYPGLPDLVANASISILSQIHQAGVPFQLFVTTQNIWSGDANLTSQTEVRIDGSLVTTLDIPALASDASHLDDIMINCPSAGFHNFSLIADVADRINETNETNNLWTYEMLCVGGVDLAGQAQDVPQTLLIGQQAQVQIITSNIGVASSGSPSLTAVNWSGTNVANISVPVLLPSGVYQMPLTISCSSPGQQYLSVYADANFTIPEQTENNNNATYPVSCICPSCGFSAQQSYGTGSQGWVPYLSLDMNMTAAPNTSLTALWLTQIHLDDYGQIYLNDVWAYNDSRPGPLTRSLPGYCDLDYVIPGPAYLSPSQINMSYGATNFMHFDNIDYCRGMVQVALILNYNISVIPPSGQSCSCPPSPAGLMAFSEFYHRTSCSLSTEIGTQCPSGICSWDSPQRACVQCEIFPSVCANDGDCCNNRCENYNSTGIFRCAYSPHTASNSPSSCNAAAFWRKNEICVPKCTSDADCPGPFVCTTVGGPDAGSGCRLPCTLASQCGSITTTCATNFCRY
jgi:hypothetical protein